MIGLYSNDRFGFKKPWGKGFLNGRLFPQTFASAVYNVCIRGCKRYPWRTHVFAFKVDQIGPGGCSALRLRRTKQASKSPALFWDKRIGRKNSPHTGHRSPWKYLLNPFSTSCSKQTTLDMIKVTTFARETHRLKT